MKRWWTVENVCFFAQGMVLLYPSQCWELTDYINSLLVFLSALSKLYFTEASFFTNYDEHLHICQAIKDTWCFLGTF